MSSLFNYSMCSTRFGSFLELEWISDCFGDLCYEDVIDAADWLRLNLTILVIFGSSVVLDRLEDTYPVPGNLHINDGELT